MFKIAYRYIISNKKSSFSAVIGIAVSIMLMFSMIQISGCFKSAFKTLIDSGSNHDFFVSDISYEDMMNINNKFESMGNEGPDEYMSSIWVGDVYENNLQSFKLIGVSGDIEYFKKTALISGNYPKSANEICIEKSYADSHPQLKINDELRLNISLSFSLNPGAVEEISETFIISGIMHDVVDEGTFFYTNLETAQSIISKSNIPADNFSNCIIVEAQQGYYNINKAIDILSEMENIVNNDKSIVRYFNSERLTFNEIKDFNYGEKGAFDSVSSVIFFLSLIIAICLTVFIYNAINLSFACKIEVLGTMRCIGLSNKQLVHIVLAEQFILVTVGAFLGIVSGVVLNYFIAEKLMSMLISTFVDIELTQGLAMYIITYLLALISSFVASFRLIFKIRKTNPVNVKNISNPIKQKTKYTNKIKIKHYPLSLAMRNLKRGFSKNIIQVITLSISFTLCFVICNVFAVIGINNQKGVSDFSDYAIASNIVEEEYFNNEDIAKLESLDGIKNIYTQEFLSEFEFELCENESVQIMLYSDKLCHKFAEINNIKYDPSQNFAVLVSEIQDVGKTAEIYRGEEKYTVDVTSIIDGVSLEYAMVSLNNYLIINDKTANELNYQSGRYCAVLIEAKNKPSELSEIPFTISDIYITDFHESNQAASAQLVGMVILASYIMISTAILSFMIISNTIKENLKCKKAEYGVMRAIGLNLKQLYTVICYENLILTIISCVIGILISLIINSSFTLILFEEIKISAAIYFLISLLFTFAIELYAYLNIKKNSNTSIVKMIHERG